MCSSIYHFFAKLVELKLNLNDNANLEAFPFPNEMLSSELKGKFPDLALKINTTSGLFTGGELIELKDSKNNSISSFNSTIPSGRKEIESLIVGNTNKLKKNMENAGDDILSLPVREVYYLVRVKKDAGARSEAALKVSLVHGKFFETLSEDKLISGAFSQMFDERMPNLNDEEKALRDKMIASFNDHQTFAQTRHVDRASISLRFRIMTQANQDGNIFNYDEISNNTFSFLEPYTDDESRAKIILKMKTAFSELDQDDVYDSLKQFKVKHHLNGPFWAFSTELV